MRRGRKRKRSREGGRKALESKGLKVSTTKTEYMCVNKGGHDGVGGQVKMQG